jgi:hypothetical protein
VNAAETGKRKPYEERAKVKETKSRRWRAGSRRNKRLKNVGSFQKDSR